jgi:hypothetical protein
MSVVHQPSSGHVVGRPRLLLGGFVKQKITGDGVPPVRVRGQGDVLLAERPTDVHLIDPEQGKAR